MSVCVRSCSCLTRKETKIDRHIEKESMSVGKEKQKSNDSCINCIWISVTFARIELITNGCEWEWKKHLVEMMSEADTRCRTNCFHHYLQNCIHCMCMPDAFIWAVYYSLYQHWQLSKMYLTNGTVGGG